MPSIGVCSWSLQPAGPDDLVEKIAALQDGEQEWGVQLALDPLRTGWSVGYTAGLLRAAGAPILSGMMSMRGEDYATLESIRRTGGVVPDEHWEANLAAAEDNARIARDLGVPLVTFHAGFIPHVAGDPGREIVLTRVRRLADVFGAQGVNVALETGQETADTLLEALGELARPAVGVNFDPANMILYGMGDPVAALRRLAGRVAQLHIKDAVAAESPGSWGTEVAVGTGQVDWDGLFAAAREARLSCDLVIEREAGDDRLADVRTARALIEAKAFGG